MSVNLNEILANYKNDAKKITELGLDADNVLDLDRTLNGKFEFVHCGLCGGPILGHRVEKYRMRGITVKL